jgi:hypothetical protein
MTTKKQPVKGRMVPLRDHRYQQTQDMLRALARQAKRPSSTRPRRRKGV